MDFGNPYIVTDIPLVELTANLSIGVVLAILWAYIVGNATRLVVDQKQYLPIFLLLIPTMILIITIIKSSIALSLGRVGALSIVRFRTPIKEPEELLYIFFAIAIGLGLGANQTLPTILTFIIISATFLPSILDKRKKIQPSHSLIDLSISKNTEKEFKIAEIEDELNKLNKAYKVKRIVSSNASIEVLVECANVSLSDLDSLTGWFEQKGLEVDIAFTDAARIIT
jgi:hypothetical protein